MPLEKEQSPSQECEYGDCLYDVFIEFSRRDSNPRPTLSLGGCSIHLSYLDRLLFCCKGNTKKWNLQVK